MRFTCQQVTERASELIDGNLGLVERVALRAHIAICRNCQVYLAQLRRTIDALRGLEEPITEDEADRLLDRILPSAGGD